MMIREPETSVSRFPVFYETDTLLLPYLSPVQVLDNVADYAFKLLFVDDGSADEMMAPLKVLAAKDKCVRHILFRATSAERRPCWN